MRRKRPITARIRNPILRTNWLGNAGEQRIVAHYVGRQPLQRCRHQARSVGVPERHICQWAGCLPGQRCRLGANRQPRGTAVVPRSGEERAARWYLCQRRNPQVAHAARHNPGQVVCHPRHLLDGSFVDGVVRSQRHAGKQRLRGSHRIGELIEALTLHNAEGDVVKPQIQRALFEPTGHTDQVGATVEPIDRRRGPQRLHHDALTGELRAQCCGGIGGSLPILLARANGNRA